MEILAKVEVTEEEKNKLKGLTYELESVKTLFNMDKVSEQMYQRLKKDMMDIKMKYDEAWNELKTNHNLFDKEKPGAEWNLDFNTNTVMLFMK